MSLIIKITSIKQRPTKPFTHLNAKIQTTNHARKNRPTARSAQSTKSHKKSAVGRQCIVGPPRRSAIRTKAAAGDGRGRRPLAILLSQGIRDSDAPSSARELLQRAVSSKCPCVGVPNVKSSRQVRPSNLR